MALTQRFGPVFNWTYQLLREGAIGDVVSVDMRDSCIAAED